MSNNNKNNSHSLFIDNGAYEIRAVLDKTKILPTQPNIAYKLPAATTINQHQDAQGNTNNNSSATMMLLMNSTSSSSSSKFAVGDEIYKLPFSVLCRSRGRRPLGLHSILVDAGLQARIWRHLIYNVAGLLSEDGADSGAIQLSYAADSYGASVTYANVEDYSGINDRNFIGLNGYWTPSEVGAIPSISVGYEMGNADALPDTTQWFVGAQWDEVGPGTAGIAVGSTGAYTDTNTHLSEGDPELLMYEAFYSYAINDGMTITPLIYTQETTVGNEDLTGYMVKTSFSF